MREVAFIRQNKEKWLHFEAAILKKTLQNPDELATHYIHLINDLSYAQTYFPKSKTNQYLNDLAARAFQKIYKTKREQPNRLIAFWKHEAPLVLYNYRRYIYYAMAVFFLFVAIGAFSAAFDTTFVRLILGDNYVNTTLENIEKGDPLAVYGTGSHLGTFIGITLNNIYVGIRAFVYGIFGGIGTGWILLHNGIMLGAFQYFFYEQGVFGESVRGIWIHGAMEIFVIIITGAAGFILGASVLFPKTYSRLEAFKRGFKAGLKVFISTLPFFIIAGFLEGFVTRYAKIMPQVLSVGIILVTLSVVSFYYLIYPYIVQKKTKHIHEFISNT